MLCNGFIRSRIVSPAFAAQSAALGIGAQGVSADVLQEDDRPARTGAAGADVRVAVSVDPAVKDHWGIPVARLSGRRHTNDVDVGRFVVAKAAELLREAGAQEVWTSVPGLSGHNGGQHQAGTCRMGNDPHTSVTNRYGQVHDIDNLFIADGSLHVTNGGFNPALTIMALGTGLASPLSGDGKAAAVSARKERGVHRVRTTGWPLGRSDTSVKRGELFGNRVFRRIDRQRPIHYANR
jgi:choline dehydrogenase-like flavoprotein